VELAADAVADDPRVRRRRSRPAAHRRLSLDGKAEALDGDAERHRAIAALSNVHAKRGLGRTDAAGSGEGEGALERGRAMSGGRALEGESIDSV